MTPLQFDDLPGWLPFADAVESLPDLAVQLGVFGSATLLVLAVGLFAATPLVRLLAKRLGAHERLQQFLVNATKVVAVPVALLSGLALAGFDLASVTLLAALVLVVVGVGMAADGLVRDVLGGFLLLVDQPFAHGDWIAVGDVEGRVERVGVRNTQVRTFDNETVTVPNATLNEQPVTNRSAQPELRQEFHFGVAYDEDLNTAMEATLVAARQVEGIADEPVPEVRAVDLAPSWVTLRATVWMEDPSRLEYVDVRSRFIQAVRAALMENGIDINPEKTEISGRIGTRELGDGAALERGGHGDD